MATTSETSIASLAALKLGQEPVRNINDDEPFADLARNRISFAIESVLRTHEWNSAHKRAILNPVAETPDFEFSYKFQLPSDFLSVRRVSTTDGNVDYEIEGKNLLSNASSVQLEYTFLPTDLSVIDPLLADTISSYLAYELAYKVTRKIEIQNQMFLDYQRNLDNAKRVNGSENRPRKIRASKWLTARFTGNTELIPDDSPR